MQSATRKRTVLSCVPCYTRKQKCSRTYPCGQCARRQRPYDCVYHHSHATEALEDVHIRDYNSVNERSYISSALDSDCNQRYLPSQRLAAALGYFQESDNNTLALIRKFSPDEGTPESLLIPDNMAIEIQQEIEKMPNRSILDFLTSFYISEVNWIDRLVDPICLRTKYQQYWARQSALSMADAEFTVLILKVCSYASHFLPSATYALDAIRGVPLLEIRSTCDAIADKIASVTVRVDWRGCIFRVQNLLFEGLRSQCQGRNYEFSESLSKAIRVAQVTGLHRCISTPINNEDDHWNRNSVLRTLCGMFVWDSDLTTLSSRLSRQLDLAPLMPDAMATEIRAQARLMTLNEHPAPPVPIEWILQFQLADFWRQLDLPQGACYDVIESENIYQRFCKEFLATLPPAFSMDPNQCLGGSSPDCIKQRQMIRIAILDSICWNFRSSLFLGRDYMQIVPTFKQVLLSSQRRLLGAAALALLDAISELHDSLGTTHTRFLSITIHTFESAVLLGCLCLFPDFPGVAEGAASGSDTEPDVLNLNRATITRDRCIDAIFGALTRLKILADVNSVADDGAKTLETLLLKVQNLSVGPELNTMDSQYQMFSALPRTTELSSSLSDSNMSSSNDLIWAGLSANFIEGDS